MASDLQAQFDTAAEAIKSLDEISDEDKGKLYGLFKQANVGDVNIDRPGMFDFTGKAKWDAWKAQEGKSSDDAKQEYIDLVNNLTA